MANQTGISFNPRGLLPSPSVKSRLVTPRELGAAWRNERAALVRSGKNTNYQGQLQRQINQITPLGQSGTFIHPFRIYQFPAALRRFPNDNDFQRFKVRAGIWDMGLVVFGGDDVFAGGFGGDMTGDVYLDPYNAQDLLFSDDLVTSLPDANNWNEALIPNPLLVDAFPGLYWIWISLTSTYQTGQGVTGGIGTICYGTGDHLGGPLNAVDLYSGVTFTENWPNYPHSDPYHILIGAVNFSSGSNVFIQQQLVSDVPARFNLKTTGVTVDGSCTSVIENYCGDYNGATAYFYGDSVTETATVSGHAILNKYIYFPPSGTAHPYWKGAITGIDPTTNSPDPWKLVSQSFIDASYVNGAYDATKFYLRTA